jgi:hypothetical protein
VSVAADESELARITARLGAVDEVRTRLDAERKELEASKKQIEAALRKKRASEVQQAQRYRALEIARAKRSEQAAAKRDGRDGGAPVPDPPNADIGWGTSALAQELNCSVQKAGYLFRKGHLGDAVWKMGARTVVFSRSKLAQLSK